MTKQAKAKSMSPGEHIVNDEPKKEQKKWAKLFGRKRVRILAFVLFFAAVGGTILWRSMAEDIVPTNSNDVIVEMSHGHGEVGDGDLLAPAESLPFRLYGNGLAVCGDYPESDVAHNAQYYSKTLSRHEVRSFLSQLGNEAFSKLDAQYASSPEKAVANNSKTITYNTTADSTQVTVFDGDSATPGAFSRAEAAINDFCSGLTTPYETANVKVRTKFVDPKFATEVVNENIPDGIEAPVSAESVQAQQQTIRADKANNVGKTSATKKGKKFFKTANGTVAQVVTSQQLPEATQKQPTNVKSTKKTSGLFSTPKAYANSFGRVRVARFCATDACGPVNVGSYAGNVKSWYTGVEVTKTYDTQDVGTIYGSNPASYYAASGDTYGRIYNEMVAKGQLNINGTPLELILAFGTGARSWCGMGTIPSDFSSKYILAITDPSDPGGGYSCSYAGWDYRTVAHELGHNFGFQHTTGQGQAGGIMGYDYQCNWPACSLNSLQAAALQTHPLFYPVNTGRLDVFARGTDRQLWHRWYDGVAWHLWEPLGGSLASGPTVAAWGQNRLDVFARDDSSHLIHKWYDGTAWRGWETFSDATIASDPDAVSWGGGRIDVVARSSSNKLMHKWYDGTWHNWETFGDGGILSGPSITSWGSGRLDVFARGTDNGIYHKFYALGKWSSWESLGGSTTTSPDAVSPTPGYIALFVKGTDSHLYANYYLGAWTNWQYLGGTLTSGPTAASWALGRLDVFARGSDAKTMWHIWNSGSGWSGWESQGGALASDPDAVSWR